MTRRCVFNKHSGPLDKFSKCNQECLGCRAVVMNTVVNKIFLLKGNKLLNMEKTIERKIDYHLFSRVIYGSKGDD